MINYDLICIGMALVDSIIKGFDPKPISASGYRAVSGSLNVGGEAVNAATAAARLGLTTGILCCLGEDEAGEMVIRALQKSGVDTGLIVRSEKTPVTTMFVHDDGTRKSITNKAHRYNFHPEKNPALFTGARALMLGSLFRAPFDDPEIIGSVLRSAKAAGQTVFADTKLPNFRVLNLEDLKEFLPLVDYITPNEDEAAFFAGTGDPEKAADVFLSYGIKNVIVKLGSRGCLLKNAQECFRLPAYRIRAVDATGAGDTFAAGFASAILRGETNYDALCFANACGAICTTAVGAGTALQSRDQVLKWMQENQPSALDITKLSGVYHVRRLGEEDLPAILSLCSGNGLYYQYCPPFVTEQGIINDMKALPPKKSLCDKYYLGYFDGEKLIAVIDLITAFPDERTADIGFFMTDASVQNAGIGSRIIGELCSFLPTAGYTGVRLGWVKGNPQAEHFWHKNRFAETGAAYDTDRYAVVAAKRDL